MKFRIFFILLITVSLNVFATRQINEDLDLDGAKFDINELPLKSHPEHNLLLRK
jgi:hypothetical protein